MQKEKYDPSNWDHRILCRDGNCIGVIGGDGRCSRCGWVYQDELPFAKYNEDMLSSNNIKKEYIEISDEEYEGTPPYRYQVIAINEHGNTEIISGPSYMTGDYPSVGYAKHDGLGVAICLVVNGMAIGRKIYLRIEDSKGNAMDVFDTNTGRWDWDGAAYKDGEISAYERIKRELYP